MNWTPDGPRARGDHDAFTASDRVCFGWPARAETTDGQSCSSRLKTKGTEMPLVPVKPRGEPL